MRINYDLLILIIVVLIRAEKYLHLQSSQRTVV